ncbi:MAG: hypothetical protein ABIS36_01330 [Chryseolinea sp.]
MRKLKLQIQMTLDGFAPDLRVSWTGCGSVKKMNPAFSTSSSWPIALYHFAKV